MTLHINDAGIWRQIRGVYVNDSGTWRDIREVYVNDAGTWRTVFAAAQIQSFTGTVSGPLQQSFSLFSTGLRTVFTSGTSGARWIDPLEDMDHYDVMATTVSANGIVSGTVGAWQNLSTTRTWTVPSAPGPVTWVIDLSFRRAFDGTLIRTNRVTIESTGQV